jgi:malonate transporter and related proteins
MSDALLLLPDFLLIALGWLICTRTPLDRGVWEAVERLVYYLLFPVLLFNSIVRSPLQPQQTLALAGASMLVLCCGIALSLGLRRVPGVDPLLHASGAQTAFRFNSYIALALGERLAGSQGVAWMALLVALGVPLCNVAAVWSLARHGGHSTGRELLRNPLIVATVGGLAANMAGLSLPDAVGTTLQRIGLAALPLGLMAVGAGLRFGGLRDAPVLASAFLAIRHLVLPAIALAMGAAFALPAAQWVVLVTFCALPTASSAYVLAVRMGGNGPFVAGLVTLSTIAGMVCMPVWLAIVKRAA